MTEKISSVPLAVLTAYYRRNLRIPPGEARSRTTTPAAHCSYVRIEVAESPRDALRCGVVGVTIVEFAAHRAYLEPVTGMGLLVAPRPGTDIDADDAWGAADVWQSCLRDGPTVGLSLQAADRTSALAVLADAGWTLLDAGGGVVPCAGHTAEGGPAVCLYADRTTYEQLVLEDFHRAFVALQSAAGLPF